MTTRRGLLSAGLFLAGAAAGSSGASLLRGFGRKNRVRDEKGTVRAIAADRVAVSLDALDRELRAGVRRGAIPDPLRMLHGLNRIHGFLFEPGKEIIIFGAHDPNIPPIDVDDLVVGLRNAEQVGPEYVGAPGCTIDPIPGADPWREQLVHVFGMPASAPMGARHVAIDYEMKQISAGLFPLHPSVPSLFDSGPSSSPCRAGEPGPTSATHRFWFTPLYPDRPRFVRDDTGVLIQKPVEVQLQSEEEFLRHGERIGGAPPQPVAKRFADAFTEFLATDTKPEYSRLRNDFRVIEVAQVLRFVGAGADRLTYLLNEHPLLVVPVRQRVRGVRRQEAGEATCSGLSVSNAAATETIVRYRRDFRGGVEAGIAVDSSAFSRSDAVVGVRRAVLDARPSGGPSGWIFHS